MSTLSIKRWIGKFFPADSCSPRKIVLLYHAVGEGAQALSEEKFKEQMEWLKENAFVLPLSSLLSGSSEEKLQVSITFDDGYACLYDVVLPMLASFGFSATVYLNTGWIAIDPVKRKASRPDLGHYEGENFLTWGEVKKLHASGWEIGSHGVDHLDLTQESNQKIIDELIVSKKAIESYVSQETIQFAYTWGRYTQNLKGLVREIGYFSAAAAQHSSLGESCDLFSFPRLNIAKNYSINDFKNILKGKWDYLLYIQKLFPRKYKVTGL